MKIYQIHDTSGYGDDYQDYIVGTYLHKEKAEEVLKKFVDHEAELDQQSLKCAACPLADWLTKEEFEEVISEVRENCPKFKKVVDDRDGDVSCRDYYSRWTTHDFKIKEVEVIE